MKTAPIVFLDFDGVTHPAHCTTEKLFTCLPLIEAVLRRHARAEIVISSSWREIHPLKELREFFAEDIALRVLGSTPVIPRNESMPAETSLRQSECETWLALHRTDHPCDHPWIAIDDMPILFQKDCPNLLLTDHRTGFTQNDADLLQSILERLST